MQIVLLERVVKLGDIGDIVSVKNGFARNYLIPKGKAVRGTKDNIELVKQRRAELEKANAEKKALAEKAIAKIEGLSVTLIRQAGEDGRLYGSVSTRDVAKLIAEKTGVEVLSENVILTSKIKEIGAYPVDVILHAEVKTSVNLNITRNEEEAGADLG